MNLTGRSQVRAWTCVLLAVACMMMGMSGATASQLEPDQTVGPVLQRLQLRAGDEVFWDGQYVDKAQPTGPFCCVQLFNPADPTDPECTAPGQGPCFVYEIDVLDEAARLWISLDIRGPGFGPPTSDEIDQYAVRLFGPNGRRADLPRWSYNNEGFVPDPELGTWTIRVIPLRATRSSFVMRARLDQGPMPLPQGPLLPNLRSIPAADFGTTAPVGYYCGVVVQSGSSMTCTKADVGGHSLTSCQVEEQVEDDAQSCLRFAVGSENAGEGPLDLRFSPLTDTAGGAQVTQVIHHGDGTTHTVDAGTYEFHKTHAHYHLSSYAQIELFEVMAHRNPGHKPKELRPVGKGRKTGFCLTDERIADWESFATDRNLLGRDEDGLPGPDCLHPSAGRMVQNAGWGDVYEYDRSGNYVPFVIAEGQYVLRSTVDADNVIVESNERDNVSYAWIEIKDDDTIMLLEHGYGTDPWDKDKVVSKR